jgi:hypothetical protein
LHGLINRLITQFEHSAMHPGLRNWVNLQIDTRLLKLRASGNSRNERRKRSRAKAKSQKGASLQTSSARKGQEKAQLRRASRAQEHDSGEQPRSIKKHPPAALLAEAALMAGDDDAGALGVGLADAVLPVVILGGAELDSAALHLAHHVPSSSSSAAASLLPLGPLLLPAPPSCLAGGARSGGVGPVPEEVRRGGRGGLRGRPLHAGRRFGWSAWDLGIEEEMNSVDCAGEEAKQRWGRDLE